MKLTFHKSSDTRYRFAFWDRIRHRDGTTIRQIRWRRYILGFVFRQNVIGHATADCAPKNDQTASSPSHVPPCSVSFVSYGKGCFVGATGVPLTDEEVRQANIEVGRKKIMDTNQTPPPDSLGSPSGYASSLAHESAKNTDAILTAAIEAVIGLGWEVSDLKGRLACVNIQGQPQETYTLDGKPILELWPIQLETINEGGKFTMKVTRNYRTFSPHNVKGHATAPTRRGSMTGKECDQ